MRQISISLCILKFSNCYSHSVHIRLNMWNSPLSLPIPKASIIESVISWWICILKINSSFIISFNCVGRRLYSTWSKLHHKHFYRIQCNQVLPPYTPSTLCLRSSHLWGRFSTIQGGWSIKGLITVDVYHCVIIVVLLIPCIP